MRGAALLLGASVLASVGVPALGTDDSKNPITKVVSLLKELKEKIISDGKYEENMYNKMACWCETTTEAKAKEIKDAKESLSDLGSAMDENKAAIASAASDISDLMKDISEAEAKKYEETTKRERQNADYAQNKAELLNAITALDKATTMLSGDDQLALIQTDAAAAQRRAAVSTAKRAVAKVAVRLGDNLPAASLAALEKFGASSKYTPFEPTIVSILKDLLDSFKATAETETNTEADLQKSYDELMESKTDELKSSRAMVKEKEQTKAAQTQEMTANNMQWQATADQIVAANELFAAAKAACSSKAEQWEKRKAARLEEMEGVDAAIETLTGDEARALINKAANDGPGGLDFLQTGSAGAVGKAKDSFAAMKRAAAKSHSLRVARMASKLLAAVNQDPKEGDEWKVGTIKEINKLLADLEVEQQVDTETYDNCKEEEHRLQLSIDNRTHEIKRYGVKLDQLNAKIEDTQRRIEEASLDVDSINAMQAKAEKERDQENKVYEEEKEDDEGAVKILTKAAEQLGKFYNKGKKGAAMLQKSAHPLREEDSDEDIFLQVSQTRLPRRSSFLQRAQGPVFEVSNQDMLKSVQDHSFTGEDSRGTAAGGIVALLTNIKEELEADIRKSTAIEEKAQAEYDEMKKLSDEEKADLLSKIDDYRDEKSSLEGEAEDNEGWKDEESSELESDNSEMHALLVNGDEGKDISFPCYYMLKNYHERRQRRDAEVQGLRDGIAFLEGMVAFL